MSEDFSVDQNGIPILSYSDIENKAEEVLTFFDQSALHSPQLTPISKIIEILKERYNIPFDFGSDLGKTKDGNKILGKFNFSTRKISVDSSLDIGCGRWNFTFAHELGHLTFHRKLELDKEKIISDSSDTLRSCS